MFPKHIYEKYAIFSYSNSFIKFDLKKENFLNNLLILYYFVMWKIKKNITHVRIVCGIVYTRYGKNASTGILNAPSIFTNAFFE